MRSSEHFLASVPATAIALAAVRDGCDRNRLAALAVYGPALGVLIDLDHFLLARIYAGDWRHLTAVLRNPTVIRTQEAIFEDVRDMTLQRLLAHVLLAGVLIGTARRVSRPLGVVTTVVLYCHLVCDLLRDNGLA